MSCRSCPLDDLQSMWRNGWVLSKKSCKNLFPQPTLFQKKRLTTWSLKTLHKNAIQNSKKTFTMNYRGQSKRHPICRGKLLSAHQGGAGRRCYGATRLSCERMRRKGGIATWVLTCQNQNGVVIDRATKPTCGRQDCRAQESGRTEKAKILVDRLDVPRRVSLFQTCCLPWLLAPWLYQVLGISWSVVFSSSELELPGSAFFARISELERRGSEDGERRDDSPWRERRAVGKVLPAE